MNYNDVVNFTAAFRFRGLTGLRNISHLICRDHTNIPLSYVYTLIVKYWETMFAA